MNDSALNKETVLFMGKLLAFLDRSDIPEGLSLDIKVGLNYYDTPLFSIVLGEEGFVLKSIPEEVLS